MPTFTDGLAATYLDRLAALGVPAPQAVADARARYQEMEGYDLGPTRQQLEQAAGTALLAGDEAAYDQAVAAAVTYTARTHARGHARVQAGAAFAAAFATAAPALVEALTPTAQDAIAAVTAGAPLWGEDLDRLIAQHREQDAATLTTAVTQADTLHEVFRLRDEVLGVARTDPAWYRRWGTTGRWWTAGRQRTAGHPGSATSPAQEYLHGTATGGQLVWLPTAAAVADNVARLEAEGAEALKITGRHRPPVQVL